MSLSFPPTPVPGSPTLPQALDAIDQAGTPSERVRAAADMFAAYGFGKVVITLRDASLNPTVAVTVRSGDMPQSASNDLQPMPGAVWRRRLSMLERFRDDDMYLLDGSDEWVAREFFATDPMQRNGAEHWLDTDLLIGLMRGADQELLGIVKLAAARDGQRPHESVRRDIGLVVRHLAARVAHDQLRAVAQQRADRLQRLQEAGAALARSLDEHEIMRELARHALRVTRGDGVTIAIPDLDNDTLTTALRYVRGVERPRAPVRLGDGVIAEVARTGRPVRIGDREADRARERDGLALSLSMYDVVGDASTASSVLAVPLRSGIQLVAVLVVFASFRDMFDAEDEDALATLGSQAAIAIANARRYAVSESERRQTEALADVARAVSESLRLGEVLRLILRHSVALLGAEGACVALRQDDYLNIVAAVGAADVLAGVHLPMATSLIGHSVATSERIISNDFPNDPHGSKAVRRLASIERTVIVPLITGRGIIGALSVINRDLPFGDADARVLQRLADHVAVAIVNARLFEEIERATREWKVAFDSIASGVVVLDEAQRVRRCNARSAELCGNTIATLLGQHFGQALLGTAEAREGRVIDSLIQFSLEADAPVRQLVTDEVRGRVFEMLAAPHPDGGCVLTFDDVTSQRAESTALARSEERYERLVESASDAIFTVDSAGRFTSVNQALLDALGLSRDAVIGATCTTFLDANDVPAIEEMIRRAFAGNRERLELRVRLPNGVVRVAMLRTTPIAEDGEIVGMLGIMRDITKEEIRRESGAQLERLAAVGQTLAGVANELNNPLASLVALAELESKTMSADAGHRDMIAQIRNEAQRASRIVAQVLDTTHAFQSPDSTSVDLNRVVRGAVELRSFDARAKGIRVDLDLAPTLPRISADAAQMQQVFTNLLRNAEEAIEQWSGERTIRVRTRETDGQVIAEVSDTGAGIDTDLLARAFEPRFTSEGDDAARGLGLAVTHAMLEVHNGTLRVASKAGEGATFTVALPVPTVAVSDPHAAAVARPTRAPRTARLLLVEDEKTLRETIGRYLSFEGYGIDVADGGRDALSLLESNRYDLILLDLRMHDMTGDEVYRAVLAKDPSQAARVLFITGDLQREEAAYFIKSTGRPAMAKPFLLTELESRIVDLLAESPGEFPAA